MAMESSRNRRGFLAGLGTLALAASLPDPARASALRVGPVDRTDAWIKKLTGKHKQLFHTYASYDGRAFEEAAAFLDIYPKAYGVAPADVNAVVAAHGFMVGALLTDAIWSKYKLGEIAKITDPKTNKPAERNVFQVEGEGEILRAGLSVPVLMKRGVTFLACNNALTEASEMLAESTKQPQADVYKELIASLLPGTVLVPAMIIAINRAQEHGLTYIYCG